MPLPAWGRCAGAGTATCAGTATGGGVVGGGGEVGGGGAGTVLRKFSKTNVRGIKLVMSSVCVPDSIGPTTTVSTAIAGRPVDGPMKAR